MHSLIIRDQKLSFFILVQPQIPIFISYLDLRQLSLGRPLKLFNVRRDNAPTLPISRCLLVTYLLRGLFMADLQAS
jgi:hypothetical protein